MFWHKKAAANLCVSGKVKVTFFKKVRKWNGFNINIQRTHEV